MDFGFFQFRTLSLTFVLGIILCVNLSFQSGRNANPPIEYPFKLTLSISHESYSRISNSAGDAKNPRVQLTLDLRLRFTNRTNRIVKLDKDCIQLGSTVVYDSPFVGPSVPLLPNGLVALNAQGCPYVADEKLKAILPRNFYDTTLQMKFEVINHGTSHPPGSLKPGSYFLKITEVTWWEIDGQDAELKEDLRKPGFLAGRSVPSELMGFSVAEKPVTRHT